MTREEIIRLLKNVDGVYERPQTRTAQAIEEAIKLVRQEPCEDAISRQAVLDKISKSVDHSLYAYKSLIECVKTLPPVTLQEPKTGWIPVSERLPEDGEDVLVWYRYWRYGEYNKWYYTYGIGYQYDDIWSVIDGGMRTTVFAWMPLPEPYKESEGEE